MGLVRLFKNHFAPDLTCKHGIRGLMGVGVGAGTVPVCVT